LPVWAFRGDTEDDFFYGLPEFQRPGIKVAHHRVVGTPDDPDGEAGPPLLGPVLAFVAEHIAGPTSLVATERCFYTMAPNEDFVLDHHPESRSVVVGAGFSGHGFKFGPLTGRILAELALDGRTSVPEFEGQRARFAYCNLAD
jgi:glycine/D-amino acid oxidase-like deaminating enzyme